MPYITLRDQGIRAPDEVIQEAAQNSLLRKQVEQSLAQKQQAFPLEQQTRAAQATESTKKAAVIDQTLALQNKAQQLQNSIAETNLAFTQETNPDRKKILASQLQQLNGEIENLKLQGSLIGANTGEANARTGLIGEQASAARLARANTSVQPGKLDPYGNQIITTTKTDASGAPLQTEQTFEKGHGLPRAVYTQKFDPQSGMMRRIGAVPTVNDRGDVEVTFPEESQSNEPSTPDLLYKDVVEKYFDEATGKPNGKKPESTLDRVRLRALQRSPQQLDAWGLNAYSDGGGALKSGAPVPSATPAPAKPVAPAVQAPSNTPGASPQTNPTPTSSVPLRTGRKQDAAAAPAAGGKQSFADLALGTEFTQNGVRYRKTSDTEAEPVNAAAAAP